jgi:hypothetical protein
LLSIEGVDQPQQQQTRQSQVVMSSATPVFNRKWTLIAPHYRAILRLYLVDAHTNRKIGTARISMYNMQMKCIDAHAGEWQKALECVEKITMIDPAYETQLLATPPQLKPVGAKESKKQQDKNNSSLTEGIHILTVAPLPSLHMLLNSVN